jgi:hypothetical protein
MVDISSMRNQQLYDLEITFPSSIENRRLFEVIAAVNGDLVLQEKLNSF